MSGELNLTGEWRGIFSYPALYPAHLFEATIREAGGLITGIIRQAGELFDPPGTVHQALIEGRRSGASVTWIKIYDAMDRGSPHYDGTIQPGGEEIHGTWSHPGDWSGTFMMVRASKAAAKPAKKVEERV